MCWHQISGALKCRACLNDVGWTHYEFVLCKEAKSKRNLQCWDNPRDTVIDTSKSDSSFIEMCKDCLVKCCGQKNQEAEADSVWDSDDDLSSEGEMNHPYDIEDGCEEGSDKSSAQGSHHHTDDQSQKSLKSSQSSLPTRPMDTVNRATTQRMDRQLRRAKILQRRRNARNRRSQRARQAHGPDIDRRQNYMQRYGRTNKSMAMARRRFSDPIANSRSKIDKSKTESSLSTRRQERAIRSDLPATIGELGNGLEAVNLNATHTDGIQTPFLKHNNREPEDDVSDIEMI